MSRSVVALVVIAFGGLAFASSPLPFVPQSQSAELVPTTSLVADLPTLAQLTADARLLMDGGLDADAAFARVSESSALLFDQFLGITDLQMEEACTGPNSYLPAVSIYTGAIANVCDPLSAFYDAGGVGWTTLAVNGWTFGVRGAMFGEVHSLFNGEDVFWGSGLIAGSFEGMLGFNAAFYTLDIAGTSYGSPFSMLRTNTWNSFPFTLGLVLCDPGFGCYHFAQGDQSSPFEATDQYAQQLETGEVTVGGWWEADKGAGVPGGAYAHDAFLVPVDDD
jgi:hypothetical protein